MVPFLLATLLWLPPAPAPAADTCDAEWLPESPRGADMVAALGALLGTPGVGRAAWTADGLQVSGIRRTGALTQLKNGDVLVRIGGVDVLDTHALARLRPPPGSAVEVALLRRDRPHVALVSVGECAPAPREAGGCLSRSR